MARQFLVVDPAPLEPPRFGLVASARPVVDSDLHWQTGLTWVPRSCGEGGGIVPGGCGVIPARGVSAAGQRPTAVQYVPQMVWEADECSAMTPLEDREERARERLLACESKHYERELWTGAIAATDPDAAAANAGAGNPKLAAGASVNVLNGGTAMPRDRALAALEEARATCTCGGRTMIHADVETATLFASDYLVRVEGAYLLTPIGSVLVPGAGYPGTGPAGEAAAAGTRWVFASSYVDLRRSPIELPGTAMERFNKLDNSIETVAQRRFATTFDPCCIAAVLVDLTARNATGGGGGSPDLTSIDGGTP